MMRKLFFRKPPDGLLEISDRVYVFNCCFGAQHKWSEERYKLHVEKVIGQFRTTVPDASVLVCNFRDEETKAKTLFNAHDDVSPVDYPRHYLGCSVLKTEDTWRFLRACENWLLRGHRDVVLMHCEKGCWPVLAFALAAWLVFRKQCEGEKRALDMVYEQAPRQLLHSLITVNQIPSQLRYLQYVATWNGALDSVPLNRVMRLDCVVLRFMPNFGGEGGCGPVLRIYGCDPFVEDGSPKLLYSTTEGRKNARDYEQGDCDTIKVNINCHTKGDVLIESINLIGDTENEQIMFRVMFNASFIGTNVLLLNRDKIDVLWSAKDRFPKDFRAEILFSEMDASTAVLKNGTSCFEEKEGLPIEAFSKVQEIFSYADWMNPMEDPALNVPQQNRASPNNTIHEKLNTGSNQYVESGSPLHRKGPQMPWEKKNEANFFFSSNMENQFVTAKQSPDNNIRRKEDKTIKADATIPRPSKSDTICQQMPSPFERTSESSNCVTNCTNLSIKLHPSDFALSDSVDTSSSDSISPQTPPPLPRLTRSVKEVHDSHPHKDSHPHHHSPSRHLTEETKSQSQDRSQSRNFSSTTGTPLSITFQNKSPDDSASHPPASAITSNQPPPLKKILPDKTELDSSPSQPQTPPPPPPPPIKEHEPIKAGPPPSPPTPPPKDERHIKSGTPPSPPPCPGKAAGSTIEPLAPPPPPPATELSSDYSNSSLQKSPPVPVAPPAPTSIGKGGIQLDNGFPRSLSMGACGHYVSGTKGHSSIGSKGQILSHTNSMSQTKKLKPLHWLKLSRAVKGSLWAETQKSDEASKAPEIDMSELVSLFSAAVPSSGPSKMSNVQSSVGPKSDKVQLIDHTRAYNCEILLSRVKVPLHDLMKSVLALEESALDTDQVENLIKFCPKKEEIEVLKGYTGEKEKLGRCEQCFLELMKVPRVESKLRVFSFKIQFHSQIKNSVKLKRIMQTILSLGNALNQGTAKGSAIGFRLDSLLKLTETRARNKKITLMHYLCKVLADKLPEVLDFSKDLANLEPAAKVLDLSQGSSFHYVDGQYIFASVDMYEYIQIQLKLLAEEMQAISKGLEKVEHERSTSENDGHISETFCKKLKEYLCSAKAEVSSLSSLYSVVGRNVDALIFYFGEDPSRCPFEQVVTTLLNFTRMFNKAHEENCKQLELEMKKTEESVK
ncbi:Formin protein 13 [Spatholobus suberectus]|nr:Formin protein 13 [Spatholobus suberectus]